jgi:hypothetical protein
VIIPPNFIGTTWQYVGDLKTVVFIKTSKGIIGLKMIPGIKV